LLDLDCLDKGTGLDGFERVLIKVTKIQPSFPHKNRIEGISTGNMAQPYERKQSSVPRTRSEVHHWTGNPILCDRVGWQGQQRVQYCAPLVPSFAVPRGFSFKFFPHCFQSGSCPREASPRTPLEQRGEG